MVLKLRHRSLADGEPEAIRNLVASRGRRPDAGSVVLVDAAGHLPLGTKDRPKPAGAHEQALEDKLVATLEPVTGAGNVRASVRWTTIRGHRGDPGDLRSGPDR